MCGIVAIVAPDCSGHAREKELISARDKMHHRGPDDSGIYIGPGIGLAHRRLSIVDVSGGHQPMANENNSIWIVFNGEIYNHLDLKNELVAKGHVYKTKCDTETVLHLYEEEGIDCVRRLDGMFAFAIWDDKRKHLYAVRDRLGIKPLYYYKSNEIFVLASEIKSLLEFTGVPREINYGRIEEYFTFKYVAGEETLFKDIYSLVPGHYLAYDKKNLIIRKYWDIEEIDRGNDTLETMSSMVKDYDRLMHQSISRRLMSDVPLGAFNSGGLDSSLITAITSDKIDANVNSFSIGFEETEYDESDFAQMVSEKYHTNHHLCMVNNKLFSDNLEKCIWLHDEPLNHANSVTIYLLSKLAKESVTVVLTGEGADEIFGGYPRYFILKYLQKYSKLPKLFQFSIKHLLRYSKNRKAQKIYGVIDMPLEEAIVYNSTYTSPDQVSGILDEELTRSGFEQRFNIPRQASCGNDLQKLFYYEVKTYLVSILNRADKMSMGASIEARVPMLAHQNVEFCMNIPVTHKLYRNTTKYFLKEYARPYLPEEIIYRKKSGFGVPLADWFRDSKGMGRYIDLLKGGFLKDSDIFNESSVNTIIEQHLRKENDHSELLWELVNFQLWKQIYFG